MIPTELRNLRVSKNYTKQYYKNIKALLRNGNQTNMIVNSAKTLY